MSHRQIKSEDKNKHGRELDRPGWDGLGYWISGVILMIAEEKDTFSEPNNDVRAFYDQSAQVSNTTK